ncbi:hypothetical protein AB0G31_16000, partial [Streptomyces fradiae]
NSSPSTSAEITWQATWSSAAASIERHGVIRAPPDRARAAADPPGGPPGTGGGPGTRTGPQAVAPR